MATVAPATLELFDEIAPLLTRFGNQAMDASAWRRMLFEHGFACRGRPAGWVLQHQGRSVGFMGLMYSERPVAGRQRLFCCLSSWIVDDAHRIEGLRLLRRAVNDHEATLVGLTLNDATVRLFSRFHFTTLEDHLLVLTPLAALAPQHGCRARRLEPGDVANLEPEQRRIYEDHANTNAQHLLLETQNDRCYVVATDWRLRRLPTSHVHFVGNPDLFWRHAGALVRHQVRSGKLCVTIDGRMAAGREVAGAWRRSLARPRLFRPAEPDLTADRVDSLYSELMFLHN